MNEKRLHVAENDARRLVDNVRRRSSTVSVGVLASAVERRADAVPPFRHAPRRVRILEGHMSKIYAAHWAKQSCPELLVSASKGKELIVWHTLTGLKHTLFRIHPWAMTCAFEPTRGRLIASGGLDNTCSVFNLNDGLLPDAEDVDKLSEPAQALVAHAGYVACARFVDEHQLITASGDSSCMAWDVERGEPLSTFKDHAADVAHVCLSPQSASLFLTASCDTTTKLWDLRTASCVKTFSGHMSDVNSVKFFPSGNHFVSGSGDATVRLYDLRLDCSLRTFSSMGLMSGVSDVEPSVSGRLVFVASSNAEAYAWDVLATADQGPALVLAGHTEDVRSVVLNAAGDALCTASWDHTLQVRTRMRPR